MFCCSSILILKVVNLNKLPRIVSMVSGTETILNIFISYKEGFKIFRSAYRSPLSPNDVPHKAVTALLPLLCEHANTPAMIQHRMLLVEKQAEYLIPGKPLSLLH